MSTSADAQRQKEMHAAEELLFAGPEKLGVGQGTVSRAASSTDWVMPYPQLSAEQERRKWTRAARNCAHFLDETLDPAAIDRKADIPREVIDGPRPARRVRDDGAARSWRARLVADGLLPRDGGDRRALRLDVGLRKCAALHRHARTARSSARRSRNSRWLPPLVSGEQFAAFALTEPEAGSDAANVQTRAEPNADGTHFILNGEKRYITNGGIAQVLTVMARTGDGDHGLPRHAGHAGLRRDRAAHGKARHSRHRHRRAWLSTTCPCRAKTSSARSAKGCGSRSPCSISAATTFGACCTGAAKTALRLAAQHAGATPAIRPHARRV